MADSSPMSMPSSIVGVHTSTFNGSLGVLNLASRFLLVSPSSCPLCSCASMFTVSLKGFE